MFKGIARVAAVAVMALGLSGCIISNWLFENASGQEITLERIRPNAFNTPTVLKAGQVTSELPALKEDGILRISAGGCTYAFGDLGPGFPVNAPPFEREDAWIEQAKKHPGRAQLKLRLDPDFTLHAFHLQEDGSIDRELRDLGFPRTPEKACVPSG